MIYQWELCYGDELGPLDPFEVSEAIAAPEENDMGAWHPIGVVVLDRVRVAWRRCMVVFDMHLYNAARDEWLEEDDDEEEEEYDEEEDSEDDEE